MSYHLDNTITESIKAVENADELMAMFDSIYDGTLYPPVAVYKTLFFCSAVYLEHDALVYRLLEAGYDVNYSFGYVAPSPLNMAVRIGREDYVRRLLEAGASVGVENRTTLEESSDIQTALELAAMMDRRNLLEMMIPLYDRMKTRKQRTPLHIVCFHGARECLDYILSTPEGRQDINIRDVDDLHLPEGHSPLMLGIRHGAWLVRKILDHGGSAMHVTRRLRYNALHLACCPNLYNAYTSCRFVTQDLPDIIRLLVKGGCNPNDSEAHGDTPLSFLCSQVKYELNTRSDVRYPYEISIHQDIVLKSMSTLLDLGASPDGHVKHLPLSVLILQLNSMLQLFSSVSLDAEIQAIFLPSAFQAASLTRDVFYLLLQRGASSKIVDTYGLISKSIIDGLLYILIYNLKGLMDIPNNWAESIVGIFADISRLLFLSGASLLQPSLVFQLFFKRVPNSTAFLSIILNFWTRTEFEVHLQNALRTDPSGQESLADIRIFLRDQPIVLKRITRTTIVRNLGSRALVSIPKLEVPQTLIDYLLSAED